MQKQTISSPSCCLGPIYHRSKQQTRSYWPSSSTAWSIWQTSICWSQLRCLIQGAVSIFSSFQSFFQRFKLEYIFVCVRWSDFSLYLGSLKRLPESLSCMRMYHFIQWQRNAPQTSLVQICMPYAPMLGFKLQSARWVDLAFYWWIKLFRCILSGGNIY